MVGRGPYQQVLPFPNNSGNSIPSNEIMASKMVAYTIPQVKQEFRMDHVVADEIANSKFPEFVMGLSSYPTPPPQSVPQFPAENNLIFTSPVELPSNDPYKLLEGAGDGGPLLFQKYPLPASTGANNSWPSNDIPLLGGKDTNLYNKDQDDDFLAQLFSEGGLLEELGNDMPMTPTNDILIPGHFPSEPASLSLSNNSSPMQPSQGPFDIGTGFNWSPKTGISGNGYTPVVSTATEDAHVPNNDIVVANNRPPRDDIQEILGDILGGSESSLLTNSLGSVSDVNYIPNQSLVVSPPVATSPADDLTNNSPQSIAPEELLIPSIDVPPPTKKPRGSHSSVYSMDTSSPLSNKQDVPPVSHDYDSSPVGSPSDAIEDLDHVHQKPSSSKQTGASVGGAGGPTLLFGQHEDAIIKKLHPQLGHGSKPLKRDKLVTMPVEEFNSLLDQAGLSEIEIAFMKEWRRRGKNKMAAQIARKRKRDELSELQDEIDSLKSQRTKLEQRARSLKQAVSSLKQKAELAEGRIYQKYSTTHGTQVTRDTHTIHITDDGKTMLIPRMSSQVLLV